jgi:hypothetical protein
MPHWEQRETLPTSVGSRLGLGWPFRQSYNYEEEQ